MNISLYLPEGSKNPRDFVNKEIKTAENIKSQAVRQEIQSGLRKIDYCL